MPKTAESTIRLLGTKPADRDGDLRSQEGQSPNVFQQDKVEQLDLGLEGRGLREGSVVLAVGTLLTPRQIETVADQQETIRPELASLPEHEGVVAIPQRVFHDAALDYVAQLQASGQQVPVA